MTTLGCLNALETLLQYLTGNEQRLYRSSWVVGLCIPNPTIAVGYTHEYPLFGYYFGRRGINLDSKHSGNYKHSDKNVSASGRV